MFVFSMANSLFFSLGKALQFLALIQVAYALIVGVESASATLELKLLLFGVLEFLAGTLLLKYTARQGS